MYRVGIRASYVTTNFDFDVAEDAAKFMTVLAESLSDDNERDVEISLKVIMEVPQCSE